MSRRSTWRILRRMFYQEQGKCWRVSKPECTTFMLQNRDEKLKLLLHIHVCKSHAFSTTFYFLCIHFTRKNVFNLCYLTFLFVI